MSIKEKREELLNHIRLIILKEREIGENYEKNNFPKGSKPHKEYEKLHIEQMDREGKFFQLFREYESLMLS